MKILNHLNNFPINSLVRDVQAHCTLLLASPEQHNILVLDDSRYRKRFCRRLPPQASPLVVRTPIDLMTSGANVFLKYFVNDGVFLHYAPNLAPIIYLPYLYHPNTTCYE